MNEQLIEQCEEVLTVEVSDEALEAAAGNALGGALALLYPTGPDRGGPPGCGRPGR